MNQRIAKAQQRKIRFSEHIGELKKRLLYPIVVFVAGGSVAYFFYSQILDFIKQSLHQSLYFQSPTGGFTLVMKICVLTGLLLAVPVFAFNLLRFIEPALPKRLKWRAISSLSLLTFALAILGGAFAIYILIPLSLHFFFSFQFDGIKPLLSANEYLNFTLNAVLSSVILFQVPLLVLLVDFIHPVSPKQFLKYEKWVIVGSLAIAIILPFTYDPITQFILAIPIIALYNFSILLVWLMHYVNSKNIV